MKLKSVKQIHDHERKPIFFEDFLEVQGIEPGLSTNHRWKDWKDPPKTRLSEHGHDICVEI